MKHRRGKLDVAEMTWTLRHALIACPTLESTIDGAKPRVIEAFLARTRFLLVHGFRILDVCHAHVFNLLRRQEPKLDLLDRLERSVGILEVEVRHDDEIDEFPLV